MSNSVIGAHLKTWLGKLLDKRFIPFRLINGLIGSRLAVDHSIGVTFVSAADSSHFRSFKQLARSFEWCYPSADMHFFDLGLSEDEKNELSGEFTFVKVRRFRYEDFPDWMNVRVNAGNYGWKAQVVAEMAREAAGYLVWMDAGNLLTASLERELAVASRRGVFVTLASNRNRDWTHTACLKAMRASKLDERLFQVAATGIVFDLEVDGVRALIETWARMSRDLNFIAPPGSSRLNHRQDQSILSILIAKYLRKRRPLDSLLGWHWPRGFANYKIHQDVE